MVKLVTDTSANLPETLAASLGISVIPFSYMVDGTPAAQDAPFDGKKFYDAMRAGADVKTSMINIVNLMEPMRAALEQGDDVIYIGMSGGISGTANAAAIAARELQTEFPARKIAAIDTYAASLGEGLQVLQARKLLDAGMRFEEVVETISADRHTMCQYFTVDDLEYLRRGGRIKRVAAVVGTVLKIKPILMGDEEGRIVLCGKARGSRGAIDALAKHYEKLVKDKGAEIGIAHADNEEGAAALLQKLRELGLTGDCLTVCYEPVTGSHVGPGTIALFFPGIHK